ncbi:MAG: aspartate kinase [Endozoicomonadaceae bacterium]|nr:aspartate kinase [Endozoicomonadaceae bacterium]
MTVLVQKFGGTSVGSIENILTVAKKVKKFHDEGFQIVVVVSAMAGDTDRLLALATQIGYSHHRSRETDALLSTGEQTSAALMSMALNKLGCKSRSVTGMQAGIITDDNHTKARIHNIDTERFLHWLNSGEIVVVTGFQGVTKDGYITTLGRGGSDTSAVAIAAALKADECQIYTDVDGVFTTDPNIVEGARRLDKITFEEMLEMASLGSKVLQIRAVEFAGKYNVCIRVLNTFKEGPGTLITFDNVESNQKMEAPLVSGIAFNRNEARVTLKGIADKPGIAYKILGVLASASVDIDMIVQSSSKNGVTDLTFTVNRCDYQEALELVQQQAADLDIQDIEGDNKVAKISVIGVGMRSHAGVAATMFEVLAENSINIQAITTSEIKISVLVGEKYLELAVRSLHSAFKMEQGAKSETTFR